MSAPFSNPSLYAACTARFFSSIRRYVVSPAAQSAYPSDSLYDDLARAHLPLLLRGLTPLALSRRRTTYDLIKSRDKCREEHHQSQLLPRSKHGPIRFRQLIVRLTESLEIIVEPR